jgi:hypothetical protein
MAEFIAYYRVSTDRQGANGLGLGAQREAVQWYRHLGHIVGVDLNAGMLDVARAHTPATHVPIEWRQGKDVAGRADPGPVDNGDYQVPFKLTAQLNKLTIAIDGAKLTPEDVKRLGGSAQQQGERVRNQ